MHRRQRLIEDLRIAAGGEVDPLLVSWLSLSADCLEERVHSFRLMVALAGSLVDHPEPDLRTLFTRAFDMLWEDHG